MNISHLQQIAIRNRKELAELYIDLEYAKRFRKTYDQNGDTQAEYDWHNRVNKDKAAIKKLVDLQCAVKAEIRDIVKAQRELRQVTEAE